MQKTFVEHLWKVSVSNVPICAPYALVGQASPVPRSLNLNEV